MRPLPDLDNTAAVIARGRASLLASARNEAEAELRDRFTLLTGCTWSEYADRLAGVKAAVQRLDEISAMYDAYILTGESK